MSPRAQLVSVTLIMATIWIPNSLEIGCKYDTCRRRRKAFWWDHWHCYASGSKQIPGLGRWCRYLELSSLLKVKS